MDPLSIAGIGLGATSLTIQAFAGCVKGYQIFVDATEVPSQYQHLLTRLRIEQTRLVNWGNQVGLLEASFGASSVRLGLNHNLINDILLEIQGAFRGCVEIQAKFNPFVEDASRPITHSPKYGGTTSTKTLLDRMLAVVEKPAHMQIRLKWALVKKDSFIKLIDSLIAMNDRIESFLDRSTFEDMRSLQVQSNMMLIQLTDEVTQLRLLSEALSINRGSAEDTMAKLAQFKAEAALIERDILHQASARISLGELDLDSPDQSQSRVTGRYRQLHVWLEWREQIEDSNPSPELQGIVDRRVKHLATLLSNKHKSPLFKAPLCLGFVCDERDEIARYALVYKVENSAQSSFTRQRSLREILESHRMPPLGQRIALAVAIVQSIFYLHVVSWLHKGVRSDNVLFNRRVRHPSDIESETVDGEDDDDAGDIDIAKPILTGFDYSRPDLVSEKTFQHSATPAQDLYRHPSLLQLLNTRSQKCHDLYSVGLILIEIALWRPIEEIVGIEVRRSRLLEVGLAVQRLNDKGNKIGRELQAAAGREYMRAVIACVVGGEKVGIAEGEDEAREGVAGRMQKAVWEGVVRRLEGIKV